MEPERPIIGVAIPPHLLDPTLKPPDVNTPIPDDVGPKIPSPEEMEKLEAQAAQKKSEDQLKQEWASVRSGGPPKIETQSETLQREEWMNMVPENRPAIFNANVQSQTSFRHRAAPKADAAEWTAQPGDSIKPQKTTKEMARRMAAEHAAFLRSQAMQDIVDQQPAETKVSLLEQHLISMKKKQEGGDESKKRKREDDIDSEDEKEKKDKKHKDKDKRSHKKHKKDKDKKHKKNKDKKDKDKKNKDKDKDKKRKREEEKPKPPPYFDRERDVLQSNNPNKRAAMIKDAASLNSRFNDGNTLFL